MQRRGRSQRNNSFFLGYLAFSFQRKRSVKGQWFIISAVVASSVFFGISVLLKDYFVVDSSRQAVLNSDYYFYNIQNQFEDIVATTPTTANCINLTTNLGEFRAVTERSLAAKGYFVFMDYQVSEPCGPVNSARLDLLVANNQQIIYNLSTLTPKQIVGAA